MEIRPIEPGDEAALDRASSQRIPEADRTFLKEDVDGPRRARAHGRRPARRARSRSRTARCVGSVAVVPLHGWSSHVGEVRLVVDPEQRGRGLGRALARRAVLDALELGLSKLVVEVIADQDGADRDVPARSASSPRRCSPTTCATARGELRDLMVLANSVDGQFAAMATAGITRSSCDGPTQLN